MCFRGNVSDSMNVSIRSDGECVLPLVSKGAINLIDFRATTHAINYSPVRLRALQDGSFLYVKF